MPDANLLARTGQTPFVDTGALLRASELASRAVVGEGRQAAVFARLSHAGIGDIAGLAAGLGTDTGLVSRVRPLQVADVRRIAAAGGVALIPAPPGWLVVAGRQAVLVTAGAERKVALRARPLTAVLGEDSVESVLLEPRLALAPMVSRAKCASPWSRLRPFLGLESRELWALLLYAVMLGGLSLAVPVAVQVLVNTIAFGSLLQPLIVLAALLFGVLVFAGVVQIIEWYAVEVLQRRIFVRVSEDFARRLPLVSYEVYKQLDVRELTNRFFEVISLQKALGTLLLDGLGLVLQTLVGLLLLAFYHPLLLAFDAALVFALGLVIALGYGGLSTAEQESAAKYRVAAFLGSIAQHPELFKRAAAGTFAAIRADALTRLYLGARRRHYARVLRQLAGGVGLQVAALVVLLGLGGWLVIRGELTLGQLVAAELVVGIIGAGFAKLGKHAETSYDLLASLGKLGKVIDLPCDGGSAPSPQRGQALGLRLQDAAVAYGDGRRTPSLSATIEPGARVLLHGPRGAGKSALLEALAGLRPLFAGSMHCLDERGAAPCQLGARAFLLRPQDVIEGTILDNLQLGAPELDESGAWEVLWKVGLGEVVAGLDGGLRAALVPDGGPLSTVEVQHLCVARALVAAPDLLLVDQGLDYLGMEATSAQVLLDAVLGPEHNWTVIVASHDPAVQRRCCSDLICSSRVTHDATATA